MCQFCPVRHIFHKWKWCVSARIIQLANAFIFSFVQLNEKWKKFKIVMNLECHKSDFILIWLKCKVFFEYEFFFWFKEEVCGKKFNTFRKLKDETFENVIQIIKIIYRKCCALIVCVKIVFLTTYEILLWRRVIIFLFRLVLYVLLCMYISKVFFSASATIFVTWK